MMQSTGLTAIVAACVVCFAPAAAHGQQAGPACAAIAALASGNSAQVRVARDTVVRDPRSPARRRGCWVGLAMPRADAGKRNAPDARVRRGMPALGWTELPAYAADGPNGTAFAMRKDDVVCFFRADWGDGGSTTYAFSASCAAT